MRKRRMMKLRGEAPAWPLQSQATVFYGNPYVHGWEDANIVAVHCPWPLYMEGKPVSVIRIHRRCSASLTRVLTRVWLAVGQDDEKIHALKYDVYDGSYVFRNKRGGSSLSMHAYGAAIDWDADDNQFRSSRHLFTDDGILVTEFKREGWVWGGDWSPGSTDAMHFQAARIHA